MTKADPKPRYHHGDLRAALLSAAESELAASGVETFSLRAVAKRAGVSHAAPAHHFGDTNGLLTALATDAFRRFLGAMRARELRADADPKSQLAAAGLGYIDFAMAHPALFRLIFSSARPDHENPEFVEAAQKAYMHLVYLVGMAGGQGDDVAAVWAMAHGLADLVMSGRLNRWDHLPPAERDAALSAVMARAFAIA